MTTPPILGILFLGMALFMFLYWQSNRHYFDYLQELSKGMTDISEGALDKTIPVEGDDELLAAGIDAAVGRRSTHHVWRSVIIPATVGTTHTGTGSKDKGKVKEEK